MATSATPLYSSLSSLSLSSSNRSTLINRHSTAPFFTHPKPPFLHSSSSSQTPSSYPLRANSGDINASFFDEVNPEDEVVFNPPIKPEGYVPPRPVDEPPFESEDDIARAYEELYGPAYSGETALGNDVYVMDSKVKKRDGFISNVDKEKPRDGFDERVVQVRRVTKVVKGGKQLRFRAIVVVGDKKGHVGVGHGKAREVVGAVEKAAADARRNIIEIPMTKYSTFPHRSDGDFGAASVMLRPATPGTGVIAGGSVRIVLEMAGVENALGKQLGSNNALNNARATVMACLKMKQFSEVAEDRGIPMQELWK